MVYSFYDGNVVMAKHALESLKGIITKAESHPDAATLFNAQLYEDMKPLSFQVHYATVSAEEVTAKLLNKEYTKPEDDIDSFAKAHARIDHALEGLAQLDRDAVDQRCEEHVDIDLRGTGATINVPVSGVTSHHNMPNLWFHVMTAYSILRKEGVPLGKRDWLLPFVGEYLK